MLYIGRSYATTGCDKEKPLGIETPHRWATIPRGTFCLSYKYSKPKDPRRGLIGCGV